MHKPWHHDIQACLKFRYATQFGLGISINFNLYFGKIISAIFIGCGGGRYLYDA